MTTHTHVYIRKSMTIIIELSKINKFNTENEINRIDDEDEIDIEEYYNEKEDIFDENEEEEYYDRDIEEIEKQLENSLQELEDII